MEHVLLKIESTGITVLETSEDLHALYAKRDRLMETNDRNLAERRYAVRLAMPAPTVNGGRKHGKNKSL